MYSAITTRRDTWQGPSREDARIDQIGASIEPHPLGCWLWTGGMSGEYGLTADGERAHRAVYEIMVGPIPEGLVLHHECEVKRCVNPAHLTPMTNGDHLAHHAALRRAS